MISTLINLILVNEDIRPAYLYDDNIDILNSMIHLFPDLNIFKFGNNIFISKQKLSLDDVSSNENIGKILGYPTYRDYETSIHSDKYNLSLYVKVKHHKKIQHVYLFNYISLTNNSSIEIFVNKANLIISKYEDLLALNNIHVYKFYSTSDFHFNNDIAILILGMLIDSNIIPYKLYKFYGPRQKYNIQLLTSYFPNLIVTKKNRSKIISNKNVVINDEMFDFNLNSIINDIYQFDLNAIVYNDSYEENVYVHTLYSPIKSKSQFKQLCINANKIIHKYTDILQKFNVNISKFNIIY
jgi:hypothetical protein